MKIIWLSANKFGFELLKEAIKNNIEVAGVITLDDLATTVMYDEIQNDKWDEFKIPVHRIKKINEELDLINKLSPDFIIMCGWRQIIDKSIIDIPKKGFIGFHPTLLPIGRGPAPIINSILNGFEESGITMFYVSEGLDEGDIIDQEKFLIDKKDYALDVYNKIIESGKKLICKNLPLLIQDKASRTPQNDSKATLFDKPKLQDNMIDLEKESINKIYNKIRALSKPYNGAYIKKDGKKLIIWNANLEDLK